MKHFGITRQYTDEKNHFIVEENEEIKNYKILNEKLSTNNICLL